MKEEKSFAISFNWEQRTPVDTERIGAMYCFHKCDVNRN